MALLTGFVQKELIKDLLRECTRMYKFEHPNVLKLSGLCLDGGPAPYIIMPFMANGSLLSYLREERESLVVDPDTTNKEVNTIICTSCIPRCCYSVGNAFLPW